MRVLLRNADTNKLCTQIVFPFKGICTLIDVLMWRNGDWNFHSFLSEDLPFETKSSPFFWSQIPPFSLVYSQLVLSLMLTVRAYYALWLKLLGLWECLHSVAHVCNFLVLFIDSLLLKCVKGEVRHRLLWGVTTLVINISFTVIGIRLSDCQRRGRSIEV